MSIELVLLLYNILGAYIFSARLVTTKAGVAAAYKTWWGLQYMVGIIFPLVGIRLVWQPKLSVDMSPCPQVHLLIEVLVHNKGQEIEKPIAK